MKTGKETMSRNNTVPWKLYTRLMLLRMIVAEHFHLKRSGTDVIYEIPCCHDSNLQTGIKNRKCLERLAEVLRGGVFKPVKVKPVTGLTLTGLNTPPLSTSARWRCSVYNQKPVTAWRESLVQELWSSWKSSKKLRETNYEQKVKKRYVTPSTPVCYLGNATVTDDIQTRQLYLP